MWRFLKVGLEGGLIAFRFVLFATLEVDLLLWPPEFEHSLRAPVPRNLPFFFSTLPRDGDVPPDSGADESLEGLRLWSS